MLPREKLEIYGPGSLTNEELMAVLLRTGSKEHDVFSLSSTLFRDHGQSLFKIRKRTLMELMTYNGMGKVKSITIQAALELGIRMYRELAAQKVQVRVPGDVFILCTDMVFLDQELVRVVSLNTKSMVIGIDDVTIGTTNASLVHPREVFRKAIGHNATSIILAHNHPSGDPKPSPQDQEITQKIRESGEILGIPLTDHIIMGGSRYFSFTLGTVFEEKEVQWDERAGSAIAEAASDQKRD